jgi:hypothetical protein
MTEYRHIDTATLDLRIEQIAAQYGISRRALTLTQSEDFMRDEVLLRLVRLVATVPGDESITVPASWVDGMKEAEAKRSPIMRWWIARHPVRYRTFHAMEVLPNFPELDRYRSTDRIYRMTEA